MQFFCNLKFPKTFTYPSVKFGTEFASLVSKSTSPELSDRTFVACCVSVAIIKVSLGGFLCY